MSANSLYLFVTTALTRRESRVVNGLAPAQCMPEFRRSFRGALLILRDVILRRFRRVSNDWRRSSTPSTPFFCRLTTLTGPLSENISADPATADGPSGD